MSLKIILASGTALAMLATAGAAFAGSNQANILQIGNDNSALITQNSAATTGNKAGANTAQNVITQNGDDNAIYITQSGDSARIGTGGNYAQLNLGVDQLGAFNKLTITQTGAGAVNTVQQDSRSSVATPTAVVNEAIVKQLNGNGSTLVSRIDQTYTGNGTVDAKNLITIDQNVNGTGPRVGGGSSSGGDQSGGLFQIGYGNVIDVDQIGKYDRTQEIRQNGDGNSFTMTQTHQGGGTGNNFTYGSQQGSGNTAYVTQTGQGNQIGTTVQTGADNSATIMQSGIGNVVTSLTQNNTGSTAGGNFAWLDFDGDDNGVSLATTNGFSAGGNAEGLGLTQGTALQMGGNNSLTYTVTTSSNLFAFSQTGDNNTINGSVSTGDANEVAVLQDGNSNTANFTQSGGGNNISISQ